MEGVEEAMKYRITREESTWSAKPLFYPESRPKWWPFWFRFDDGIGYQVVFTSEAKAQSFIDQAKEARHE